MSGEDIAYYRQRAAIERSRVADAPTAQIASVHEKLAHLYEELISRMEQSRPARQDLRPTLHIATPAHSDTRL